MAKKQEVYVPQFLDETITNEERAVCKCCGANVTLKNLNNDGFCVACIMNNKTPIKSSNAIPNTYVHNTFLHMYKMEQKRINKKSALLRLVLPPLAMANSPELQNQISKLKTFKKANETTIIIHDETWVCPCCLEDNSGAHYCKKCGVYPKFELKD